MIDWKDILFLIVVLISNIIQSITGFAGTVLAMPFSIMLVGYNVAKPILNVLGIVISFGVIMSVGMVAGMVITKQFHINPALLYKVLGGIVLFFVGIGVFNALSQKRREKKGDTAEKKPGFWVNIILIIAGVVHGMFVCGGPLLVVYASQKMKGRDEFRVTVSAVWAALNTVILFSDIRDGYFNPKLLVLMGIAIGILFGALWIGNVIFKHINKKWFMIITYVLMGISGISLLIK